jgi:hypothetical protein
MSEPLDERVAELERQMDALRDEASRYRSDIAIRDELYVRTGSALLTFMRILLAQMTVYRDAVLDGNGEFPAIIKAFDVFVSSVVAELGTMIAEYEPMFADSFDVID